MYDYRTAIRIIKQYKDKAYINSLLAEESCNHYSYTKNIINIPLNIYNSGMLCINSIIQKPKFIISSKYTFQLFNRSYIIAHI